MKDIYKRYKRIALAGCAVLALGISAQAALITGQVNVDFNGGAPGVSNGPTASGPAVVGSAGDAWNGFNTKTSKPTDFTGSSSGLKTTDGTVSDATLTFTAGYAYHAGTNPINNNLLDDWLIKGNVTIGGLDASRAYDIYVYNASDNTTGRTTTFTLTGAAMQSANSTFTSAGQRAYIEGNNYLMFTVQPDAGGQINIVTAVGPSSSNKNEADFNGFQLVAGAPVPEPASIALLGLGSMVLLGRRRRQSA